MKKYCMAFFAAITAICTFGIERNTNSYIRLNVAYAQRGNLRANDYVVTNVDVEAQYESDEFASAVARVSPPVELPEKWALANVTNAHGNSVAAADVGAISKNGIDVLNSDSIMLFFREMLSTNFFRINSKDASINVQNGTTELLLSPNGVTARNGGNIKTYLWDNFTLKEDVQQSVRDVDDSWAELPISSKAVRSWLSSHHPTKIDLFNLANGLTNYVDTSVENAKAVKLWASDGNSYLTASGEFFVRDTESYFIATALGDSEEYTMTWDDAKQGWYCSPFFSQSPTSSGLLQWESSNSEWSISLGGTGIVQTRFGGQYDEEFDIGIFHMKRISKQLETFTKVAQVAYENDLKGYVPTSRKVNGQPLTEDITIEGMSDNALVFTNDEVKTTSGLKTINAVDVSAVPLVEDANGEKTAVTIGNRTGGETVGLRSLANGSDVEAYGDYSHAEGFSTTAYGDYSHAEGFRTTTSGPYSHAEGIYTTASGDFSHAEGKSTTASGDFSHADGYLAHTKKQDTYAFAWNGDEVRQTSYTSHGPGTFNVNPSGGLDGFYIGERTLYTILTNKADKSSISATDPTFSNAVLAVGLNIDTNSVAVINDIAATFGGFPLGAGETATTVGGLLAALAAAVAWLKKNKVQTLKLEDGSVETSADGGVAKLDDFFTESNSLLNGRLAYSRNATGLKDRAFNELSFDGTEFNLSTALEGVTPTTSGQPRDLLIVATATAATTISFTAGTIKGDKPTIDGSGTWLITLTEYASGVWYCRQIKMEDAA